LKCEKIGRSYNTSFEILSRIKAVKLKYEG